ncbi:MAG: hypothetical protein HKL80_09460, partial [Acidimicrobiales bacterium]|nr:hypothetical protein [Acidimicrobiales bacterium]
TEIARQAKKRAQETIEQAEANARHLQREAEDFCDRKLAAFEIALNEVGKVVKAGRDRLAVRPISMPKNEENLGETGMGTEAEAAFFDQDISDSANLQKSEYSDGFEE